MRYILIVFLLTACTSAQRDATFQGSSVAGQLIVADQLLQSGIVESTVLSIPVRPEELAQLQDAFAEYEASREQIGRIIDYPERVIDAPAIIRQEHARLIGAFDAVQQVVAANYDEYSEVAQSRISRWRWQAYRLEIAYQRMAEAVEQARGESARRESIIQLARIVAQMALMYV